MKELPMDDKNVLIRKYAVRRTGAGGSSIETTIPKEVFERECRRQNLSVDQGVKKLRAVWHYGNFQGLYLTFELIGDA